VHPQTHTRTSRSQNLDSKFIKPITDITYTNANTDAASSLDRNEQAESGYEVALAAVYTDRFYAT
jgi:hypothetical protein